MRDARGFTLVEVIVASLATGVILAGLSVLYLSASRAFTESDSQAVLQRQGTLALEEIARQVRSANTDLTLVTCNDVANALRVTNSRGTYCYYAGGEGQLCEAVGANCRNLLAGALKPLALLRQPPADPRCPPGAPSNGYCLVATHTGDTQADFAFTIADAEGNATAFSISLTRRN
jgi:prepilin-type N-terminal cleavage/methylation domain-containing protein